MNAMITPQRIIIILGTGSCFMIMMAAYFQYVLGLAPCTMCYWQRAPHWVVIVLAIISILPSPPLKILPLKQIVKPRLFLGVMMAVLIIGAGIAAWHAGVELKILPGPTACSSGGIFDGDPSDVLDRVLSAPVVRCDEPTWSLFGISMAGWNGLISIAMAAAAALAYRTKSAR